MSDSQQPVGIHRALIYRDRDELVSAAGAFLREGLRAGDQAVIVAAPRKLGWLREELGSDAAEVAMLDAGDWYARIGRAFTDFLRLIDRRTAEGHRLRLVAEGALAERPRPEARAYMRYEAAANVAVAPYPAAVLCPYDAGALPEELVIAARRTHPEVVEDGRLRRSERFAEPAAFVREPLRPARTAPAGPALTLARAEDLAAARKVVATAARRAGLAAEAVSELVGAVNEVATNALLYGRPPREVRVMRDGSELVCHVSDAGPGIREPFAGYLPPRPAQPRGRGLWIAHQLCDLVEVQSGPDGTAVWLHAAA